MNNNGTSSARCKLTAFIKSPLQSEYGPYCPIKGLVRSAHLCYSWPNDDSLLPLGLLSHQAFIPVAQHASFWFESIFAC